MKQISLETLYLKQGTIQAFTYLAKKEGYNQKQINEFLEEKINQEIEDEFNNAIEINIQEEEK